MTVTRDRFIFAALPVVAIVTLAVVVAAAAASSAGAGTLGFDFGAYHLALRHLFSGGVLYDQSYATTGGFGLFYYPPTFMLLAAPLALFDSSVAVWLWTVALVVAFVLGVAILPLDRRIRWLVLLLGGISWPLVYAIKLGQVGPVLFLTFAIGWRWMERPWRLGAAIAVGTAIKLQPALLFAWALVTGRRRAVAAGIAVLGILALVATLLAGPSAWVDQATLLAKVSQPIETVHSLTPGRLAFEAGASLGLAWAIQVANWILVGIVLVVATLRCRPVSSYLAVVVASQLASPILWDHYALLLLLPVAWLLSLGRRWAVVIPLATSIVFVGWIPPFVYPLAYWVTMLAVVWEGWVRSGRRLPAQANRESGAILPP